MKILSEAKKPDGDITNLRHPELRPFYKEEVSISFFKTIDDIYNRLRPTPVLIRYLCKSMIDCVAKLHSRNKAHNNISLRSFVELYNLKIEMLPSKIESGLFEEPPFSKLPPKMLDKKYYSPEVLSAFN